LCQQADASRGVKESLAGLFSLLQPEKLDDLGEETQQPVHKADLCL
jgi:hypothetical protein